MQYEYEPSQQQRAIIEEPRLDIPLKVVAGAGSGKTFVLAHRFVWLVVSGKVPEADRILALTFTKNAAAEMKMRIKRLLRLNGHAVSSELWVHTFHSFAARLLRECSYQVGISPEFQLLTEIRQQVELDRVIEGIFAGDFAQNQVLTPNRLAHLGFSSPGAFRVLLTRLIRYAKGGGLGPAEFRGQTRELSEQFWAAMPTAREAAELDSAEALAPELQRRLGRVFGQGTVADAPVDVAGATLELRRLYYADLKSSLRDDLDQRLEHEREIERAILDAAEAAYQLYQQRLAEGDSIDFNDQIMMARELLADNSDIRRRYQEKFQYILVDEFQDTSPAQMKMVQALARPARLQVDRDSQTREADSYCRLMVVGDQKQSIYGWRDARPENLDRLLPFTQDDKVGETALFRPLTVTYRMDQQLTVCANCAAENTGIGDPQLASASDQPGTIIKVSPFVAGGDETIRHARRREAAYIAEKIQELVAEQGRFNYGDICVLMRRRMGFRLLKAAFEQRQVPYQAMGGVGFFDHPLARDVLALARVIADPFDDASLVRLLTRPPISLNDRQLFLLATTPDPEEDGEASRRPGQQAIVSALAELVEHRDEWRSEAEHGELPGERLEQFFELLTRLRRASVLHPARSVLEMMLESIPQSGMTAAERCAAGAVKATFEAIIKELDTEGAAASLNQLVRAVDLYEAEEGLELPTADVPARDAVQVMTIHGAKGLGFPAVFVMAWDPKGRASVYDDTWGLVGFNVDGEDSARKRVCKLFSGNEQELREEKRLWYVALTRAEQLVCVTYAAGAKGKPQIPWGEHLVGAQEESGEELAARVSQGPGYRPAAPLVPTKLTTGLELASQSAVIHTSFSALCDVLACPLRWWMSRNRCVGELLDEAGSAAQLAVGSCFHKYVAAHYRRGQPPDEDYLERLCRGAPVELDGAAVQRIRALVAAFQASPWAQQTVAADAVERPVHLVRQMGEAIVDISGKVDLVLSDQQQFVDFKTNRHLSEADLENYALQMFIYQQALAAPADGGDAWRPLLVHVTPEGLEEVEIGPPRLTRQQKCLQQALSQLVELELSQQRPPAPPTAPCIDCQYADWCTGVASDKEEAGQ